MPFGSGDSHFSSVDPGLYNALAASRFTAAALQGEAFPALASYVEGFVVEGLTILAGRPKLGKSWLALNAAIAVASGGVAFGNVARPVTPAPVLYLALEDGPRRLQDRFTRLLAPGENWPQQLSVNTDWPRLDHGGLEALAATIDAEGFAVVIVDTIGRLRSAKRGGGDRYLEDVEALSELHDLTRQRPGLAVFGLHHSRKNDHPDDFVDALSGTTGISGVADHIAVLQRSRGEADAVFRFTSRDAAEHDTALSFVAGTWTELGAAAQWELSKARRAVLAAVETLDGASLSEIAAEVDKDVSLTRRMLVALADEGLVHQDGERGPWKPGPNGPRVQTESDDIGPLDQLDPVSEAVRLVVDGLGGEVVSE